MQPYILKLMKHKDLQIACRYRNYQQIESLLKDGASVNYGLNGACEGGHKDIAQMMIDKGAICWNFALWGACEYGQIEMAQMIIDKGGDKIVQSDGVITDGWKWGFEIACGKGYAVLMHLMVKYGSDYWNSKGPGYTKSVYDTGLCLTCHSGHIELAQQLIEMGANDLSEALRYACEGGHAELALQMIDRGADPSIGLLGSCKGNNAKLAQLMIGLGAKNFCEGMREAYNYNHFRMVQMMIYYGANDWGWVLMRFETNTAFILRILWYKRRRGLVDKIKKKVKPQTLEYFVNRHGIHKAHLPRSSSKKYLMHNVAQQFVCNDVATFSALFVGIY